MSLNREMNRTEEEMFSAWRSASLQKMPYLAPLLFALTPLSSTWIDTAAVDDSLRLYLNFKKISEMGPSFGADALLHECSHVIAGHSKIARQMGISQSEHDLWNIAADLAINDDLVESGCDTLETYGVVPSKIRLNGKVLADGLTPNEYFIRLREAIESNKNKDQGGQGGAGNQQPNGTPDNSQGGQGSQNGQGDQSDQGGAGDQDDQGGKGQSQGDQPQPKPNFKGCGSGSGAGRGPGELAPGDTMNGVAEGLAEEEVESVIRETTERMQEHIKSRGSIPAGLMEIIDKVNQKDEIRWEKVLSSLFRRGTTRVKGHNVSSYRRINRRRATERLRNENGEVVGRIIYPGKEKYVPVVRVYVDTSMSVSKPELEKALAIVMNLSKRMKIKGDNLTVTYVDAKIQSTSKFKGLKSIQSVKGRGGTDMRVCFTDANEQKKKPDLIVIITDGYTPWPKQKPGYETIVCNTQEHDESPSWIKSVFVKVDG